MSKKTTPRGSTPGVHFRLPEQTLSQLEDIQRWLARERAAPEVNRTEALLYAVGEAWKRLAKKHGKNP